MVVGYRREHYQMRDKFRWSVSFHRQYFSLGIKNAVLSVNVLLGNANLLSIHLETPTTGIDVSLLRLDSLPVLLFTEPTSKTTSAVSLRSNTS